MGRLETAFVIVLLYASSAMGTPQSPLILNHHKGHYDANSLAVFLEDSSRALRLEDVLQQSEDLFKPSADRFSGGYSDATYWLKLQLKYELPPERRNLSHDWILEIDYAALDYVDVYYPVDGVFAQLQSGDRRPQSVRRSRNNFHVFYLRLPPNQATDVYIKVRTSSSLQIPLSIWSPAEFFESRSLTRLGHGVYLGVLFIMAAYNLMLFFSLRERSYLYYVLYISAFAFLQSSIAGLTFQYLWPDSPAWNNVSIPFLMGAAFFFAVLFTRSFLATHQHSRYTDWLIQAVGVFSLLVMLLSIVANYQAALTSGNLLTMLGSLVLLWSGALATYKKVPGAIYFLLGWAFLLLGSTIFMLVSIGMIQPNTFTENAARYGSALEALLLALALGEKIKVVREEKTRIADKARADLQAGNRELSLGLAQREHNDSLKDEFLANVSHELRTPLNGILGSIELMRLEPLSEEVEEYAHSAQVSADHMLELVNSLLSFSEAKAKQDNQEAGNLIDLRLLTKKLRDDYLSRLRDRGLRLVVEFDPTLPQLLWGDSSKLELVLGQLLDEAIKNSSGGRISLSIAPEKLSINSSRISFALQDCGPGIPTERLEAAFDPFMQTGRDDTGHGMGMAICKQLVQRMKGNISALPCDNGALIRFVVPFELPKESV